MIPWRSAVAAFVASMALQAGAQPAGDDFKQTKEWKALNRYVGIWDDQATLPFSDPQQRRFSASWTLGDRFLQIEYKVGDNAEMQLLTCNPKRGTVRGWWFSSYTDATPVYTGSWDEATNTFTFTFKEEDGAPRSFILTDHFIDDDHREWKGIVKNSEGKLVVEVSGKATRQRK